MKLPSAIAAVLMVICWVVLVVWARRQDPDTTIRWRRWLRWVPACYTIAGTAMILLGCLGQATRDLNFFLRCCFYIPLPIFGIAALLHDALMRGRAYPRVRCGFGLLGVAAFALGLAILWQWEGVEPSPPEPNDVRVMQWNVHWGGHPMRPENWELLRADIEAHDPDVLILNEAPFEKKHWIENYATEKGWSLQRGTQAEDPWEAQLVICSRWKMQCEVDTPVFNGRVLLMRIDRPERAFRVMMVDAESNVVSQSRVPMMEEIERILTAVQAGGQTVDVVAGDFNTPGRSIAFDGMAQTAGGYALASRSVAGWPGTWPSRYPLYDIDHVWVHRSWKIAGCERFMNGKTDHRAQMVTIRPQ